MNDPYSSRHNPDFVDRTLTQRLEIENLLASFRRQLMMIVKTEDQAALADLHSRMKAAGEGFGAKELEMVQPHDVKFIWHDEEKRMALITEVESMMADEGTRVVVGRAQGDGDGDDDGHGERDGHGRRETVCMADFVRGSGCEEGGREKKKVRQV